MKQDKRYINELIRIVRGALKLDIDKVRNYTEFLAEKLEAADDRETALLLRRLLSETEVELRPTYLRNLPTVPVDEESRFPLVESVNVNEIEEPTLFLSEKQWYTVNEFLSVSKSYAFFEDGAFSGALSLLIHGLPGTGKSRLARYIAKELGLPLYLARLDGLISSFLGSTSKNIRALIEFASKTPCILFLDEFDAIAKLRTDQQELGELKRVVNSFVQNLDTLGQQSIVLAATNHESLLDSAVWRRFSYRLALTLPDQVNRQKMWEEFLSPTTFQKRELRALSDLSEGYSGSDIREVCIRLKRRHHVTGEPILLTHVFAVLQNLAGTAESSTKFLLALNDADKSQIICTLRRRDQRLYSQVLLATLLGLSRATVQRALTQQVISHG